MQQVTRGRTRTADGRDSAHHLRGAISAKPVGQGVCVGGGEKGVGELSVKIGSFFGKGKW